MSLIDEQCQILGLRTEPSEPPKEGDIYIDVEKGETMLYLDAVRGWKPLQSANTTLDYMMEKYEETHAPKPRFVQVGEEL